MSHVSSGYIAPKAPVSSISHEIGPILMTAIMSKVAAWAHEEVGELSSALVSGDHDGVVDAILDLTGVLALAYLVMIGEQGSVTATNWTSHQASRGRRTDTLTGEFVTTLCLRISKICSSRSRRAAEIQNLVSILDAKFPSGHSSPSEPSVPSLWSRVLRYLTSFRVV